MYFEREYNELAKIQEAADREEIERKEDARNVRAELEKQTANKQRALSEGRDEDYIKTVGMIAVLEAKLNKIESNEGNKIRNKTVRDLVDQIREEHEKMQRERAQNIMVKLNDIFADIQDMRNIWSGSATAIGRAVALFPEDKKILNDQTSHHYTGATITNLDKRSFEFGRNTYIPTENDFIGILLTFGVKR